VKGSVSIEWQGEFLNLLPDRAVYWPKEKILYVADTHFGKAATFRKVGIPVSEHTTAEDCERLSKLMEGTGAEKLIILGDFLHARAGRAQPVRNQLFDWRDQHKQLNIFLIRGNHDQQSGDPWSELDIECMPDPTEMERWDLRHLPVECPTRPYLAGHLHPGYRLSGTGRDTLRSPCWVIGEKRIILPAFGAFTGLKNVTLEPCEKLYLTNGKEIIPISKTV
jgi:DNA ligase-associated metallophosphoesterase